MSKPSDVALLPDALDPDRLAQTLNRRAAVKHGAK